MVESNLSPDYPITDIFIVSEKTYCPPGYQVIDLTTDGVDADLWKDKFLRKSKRYLCFTRKFAGGDMGMVIQDMTIVKENGDIPDGYTSLNVTKDSAEPSLKKKQIVVKYVNRSTTQNAIREVFLTKNSKVPVDESHVRGEINGLTLSVRYGIVTKQSQPLLQQQAPAPSPRPRPVAAPRTTVPQNAPITRSGTMKAIQLHNQPLDGVSFQINNTFKALSSSSNFNVPKIPCLTSAEVDEKYKYDFQTERIAEQRLISP